MDISKVQHEGALLLEQPFVKVPYEQFRKIFKTVQKHVERDFIALQGTTNELVKKNSDSAEAVKAIDGMIVKVESLKRKLSDLQANSNEPAQASMRRRLTHLATFESITSTDQPELSDFAATRLDRWLVDWALRNGREETAKIIAKDRDIETFVDTELFSEMHHIEEALRNHSCTEALSWCNQNKSSLSKMKISLEFDLRLQEYIELARALKREEAIAYTKKYLTPFMATNQREIMRCFGLLACGPDTDAKVYKNLYDTARWTTLIQTFRNAAYALNALPTEPLLNLALYAGLASLKLPGCYDELCKNVDCPVCDGTSLGQLAKEVPFSHHINSTIVCRLSGKIMDGDNPPMAFPNGYVYSQGALKEMAARHNGQVTCPRSKYVCDISALRKVYIS